MWAVTRQGDGGPEQLGWGRVEDPQPGPGEVVIRVVASAVNRADLLQRQGFYPPPPGASAILGLECSGHIEAVGEGVTGWQVGLPVCALLSGGGYAQKVSVPVGQVMELPAGVDVLSAAALPEVACTVWSNVVDAAGLRAGEVLLCHGGASGIGTMAIQVAKALGARVAVTVGSQRKAQACRDLGADLTVDYPSEDFVAVVRDAFGGADVVLDNMGAKYLARNVAVLRPDGRLMVIGLQGGTRAELDLSALLALRGSVTAMSLRGRPAAGKAAVVAGTVADLWPMLADGRVRPVVDRVLPMSEAAEAHRLVEAGAHIGKVVLSA